MPELPEVQNTVEGLRAYVIGKTINHIWTDYYSAAYIGKKQIKDPDFFTTFYARVVGKTISDVRRRGKQIFIILDEETIIAVHMKMTGHFLYGSWNWDTKEKKWCPPGGFWNRQWAMSRETVAITMPLSDSYNDFIHLMFIFNDDSQLALSDMRTFASITLLDSIEEMCEVMSRYGLEPLDPRVSITQCIDRLTRKKHAKIKTALLDQSLIAGFGNIYSDETLYAARVHPESIVSAIPHDVMLDIVRKGKQVLRLATKHGGDSTGDYRNIDGTPGTYHNMHKIYQRDGKSCMSCNTIIEKKKIGQRVGRFCRTCQVLYV